MKTLIIDDDHATHPFIERTLVENFGEKVAGVAYNMAEAKKLITETKPDLIFLDINLPDGKGYDLVNEDSEFKIIFITAYNDYAVKAFELAAMDYLLKPLKPDRIVEAFNRCRDSMNWNEKYSVFNEHNSQTALGSRIVIKKTEGFDFIKISDIIYCESDGNYTRIFTTNKPAVVTSKTLGSIEALLIGHGFFRCHKSYLINLQCIESFKSLKSQIELVDGTTVSLSRARKRKFLELVDKLGSA